MYIKNMEYYAHLRKGQKETLMEHLTLTAELAGRFGASFGCEMLGRQLGLLHDIGKRTKHFQEVLEGKRIKQDHAIVGGMYAFNEIKNLSKEQKMILSIILAGHHAGLYCGKNANIERLFQKEALLNFDYGPSITKDADKQVVLENEEEYKEVLSFVNSNNLDKEMAENEIPDFSSMTRNEEMLWTRMLFSCLVDADYTATSFFMNNEEPLSFGWKGFHSSHGESMRVLLKKLDTYHEKLVKNSKKTPFNKLRNEVYDACGKAGKNECGIRTLTAPTGMGKTLSLAKFALENAVRFGKERIFVVLPYLAIIEQNTEVYKSIFGEENVLRSDSMTEYTEETKLYSERWDSPIVVTTSVSFFHAIFSGQPTVVRKLHHLANSVVVFDECQTLPHDLVETTMEALQILSKDFGATVLLSTATTPSYEYRNHEEVENSSGSLLKLLDKSKGKKGRILSSFSWEGKEVLENKEKIFETYAKYKNTSVETDKSDDGMTADDVVSYFANDKQVLVICNTIAHAKDIYRAFLKEKDKDKVKLVTGRFCAEDKLRIVEEINKALKNGEEIYVAATQCVEAGVDFDFPVGAREYSPYDSEIQSAGRLNRNGLASGRMLLFYYENHGRKDYPSGSYQSASELSRRLALERELDLYDQETANEYWRQLYTNYAAYGKDRKGIHEAEQYLDFFAMEKSCQLIENTSGTAIFVVPPKGKEQVFEEWKRKVEASDFCISNADKKTASKMTVQIFTSNTNNPLKVGVRLSFRNKLTGEKVDTNWFLLISEKAYGEEGLDLSYENGEDFVI